MLQPERSKWPGLVSCLCHPHSHFFLEIYCARDKRGHVRGALGTHIEQPPTPRRWQVQRVMQMLKLRQL